MSHLGREGDDPTRHYRVSPARGRLARSAGRRPSEGQAARCEDRATKRTWLLLAEAERGHAAVLRHQLRRLESE